MGNDPLSPKEVKALRFLNSMLICLFVSLPLTASAEYNTIDDIVKDYSDEACKGCHAAIHKEWKESFHSQSILHSLAGMKGFITAGIKQEWAREVTKTDLMKCFHCHAPQLYEAADALVKKVAELIVTAVDEQDTVKKDAARKELS